jgi:putative spermidine/putrescine transport system substrate-binding protein
MNPTSGAISRRRLLQGTAAGLAAPMLFQPGAWAQGKTIQMGIWGGVQGDYIRKVVIPPFEQKFGCKVLVEEGVTLSQIARMRATKDDPKYSIMFIDPLGIEISKRENLIAPLPTEKMPNMANVYPRFVLEGGYGVAFGVTAAGMFYNPKAISAPAS